jgi:hypothetical protein
MKPKRKSLAEQKVELILRGELHRKTIVLELKKIEMDRLIISNTFALITAALSGWKLFSAWRKDRTSRQKKDR